MLFRTATLGLGLLSVFAATADAGGACTFLPNCDYGKGSRDNAPATTKEECCSACEAAAKDGCVAGVFDGTHCWFKKASDIVHGCVHSPRSKFACLTPAAPHPPTPPPPPSPHQLALEKQYADLMEQTCAKVTAKAPAFDESEESAFMDAFQNLAKNMSDTEPVLAAAEKLLDSADVKALLSAPDSFTEGGLDASMVLCSLLTDATPAGLAEFAGSTKAAEAAVTQLLGDFTLMRDMLVAGGAVSTENGKGREAETPTKYGQAMGIYLNITKASAVLSAASAAEATAAPGDPWDDRTPANVLKRVALGTALQHAVPIHQRYSDPLDPSTYFIDPVDRYMEYEQAYKAGSLDPAFEVLTTFEVRHTTNTDAMTKDQQWARASLAIYRPDHIATGYGWRYTGAVKTEVAYGDPQCPKYKEGVCSGHMSDIPAADGVCGPRAFFGRFIAKSFGIPTWGATEPGHAAMSAWTPTGWRVLLGAGWPSAWWGERGGVDWYLETQARELRPTYQQVLRGDWLADATNETKCVGRDGCGTGSGGTWRALMWSLKTSALAATPPTARELPAKSVVPTKVEALLEKFKTQPTVPKITTDPKDGTITVPAAAFSSKNRSASVTIMQSADEGSQILHGGCRSDVGPPCAQPQSSAFVYEVTSDDGGSYYLTANHTTWHPNQNLSVSVNDGAEQDVPVYYTVGWWNETLPIEVTLTKGKNTLSFSRTSVRELAFKEFLLYKQKPSDIKPPPANFTPTPAPVYPDKSSYIEVPAATTCIKQGITPVPEADCSRACGALGFKSTGDRARANISGCFVMTEGPYAGNCNFNTNKSATCEPPCTLMGSEVRSLCMRK